MLDILSDRLRKAVNIIRRAPYVDEKILQNTLKEIQKALLLSDVNVNIVVNLTKSVKEKVRNTKPHPGLPIKDYIISIIYNELVNILGGEEAGNEVNRNIFNKILMIGIQGSGKTTTAAKLAYYYKKMGLKVGLLSTDTYRPAGREQLRQLSNIIGVDFFDIDSNDPIEIARKGLSYFKEMRLNLVIIDTAGRHKEEKSLLREMEKIYKYIQPTFTFLVIDASIGQQAYSQALAFHESVPIGGIIITKMDGTAKGGGALSAASATGAKVYYLGTGEKIEDLEKYDPQIFVSRLLGIKDIKNILKKLEHIKISEEDTLKLREIAKGKFTLIDMIKQLEDVSKFGGLYRFLDLIPGLNIKIPKHMIKDVEKKIEKWRHIINSMTIEEKINPSILNKSRITRIARGSGVEDTDVKDMIKHYNQLRKMLRSGKSRKMLKILERQLKGDIY